MWVIRAGVFSRRLPVEPTPNEWSQALDRRRARGGRLHDLTDQNPTTCTAWWTRARHSRPSPTRAPRVTSPTRAASRAPARRSQPTTPAAASTCTWTTSCCAPGRARRIRTCSACCATPGARSSYRRRLPAVRPLAALDGVELRPLPARAFDGRWRPDPARSSRVGPDVRGGDRGAAQSPDRLVPGRGGEGPARRRCASGTGPPSSPTRSSATSATGARQPLPSFVGEARVPTFVLSGLSKVCGMPQMKLGWIVVDGPPAARDAALRGLEWIADLFLSVSTPVQVALPRLLEARGPFQQCVRERVTRNLVALDRLVEARPELSLLAAQGGWAAVVRVPRTRTEEEWSLGLLARDVVVHPGHFYDFADEGYLVLRLIPEPDVFHAGCARSRSSQGRREPAPGEVAGPASPRPATQASPPRPAPRIMPRFFVSGPARTAASLPPVRPRSVVRSRSRARSARRCAGSNTSGAGPRPAAGWPPARPCGPARPRRGARRWPGAAGRPRTPTRPRDGFGVGAPNSIAVAAEACLPGESTDAVCGTQNVQKPCEAACAGAALAPTTVCPAVPSNRRPLPDAVVAPLPTTERDTVAPRASAARVPPSAIVTQRPPTDASGPSSAPHVAGPRRCAGRRPLVGDADRPAAPPRAP